jgi:Cof subfamily protein (haloacid dehalogenase superfamily)
VNSTSVRLESGAPGLVATDLDGTLLGADGQISPYTAEVLAALDERGIPVVFVTGRPLRWVEPLFWHVDSHGLAVVSNGALVWDVRGDRPELARMLAPEAALEVATRLRAALPRLAFAIEDIDGWAMESSYPTHRLDMRATARQSATLEELLAQPVLKLLAVDREADPDELLAVARPLVGELVQVTHSSFPLLEMSSFEVTKASALAIVAERHGVAAEDVVAFGDMPNDLPMLTWAGRSYAMADAHPDVVACASDLAPRHDEDGVARVLAGLVGL